MTSLYPIHRYFWRFVPAGCMATLVVFLWTMAHTVYFEDSGLFGMVCYDAGVAHPPSFPIYALTCPIFAHLPWLTPIHGVAIFSALNATIACFFIALIVMRMTGLAWAGCLAALVYGFSNSLWSQAVIQEVYTLNVALFFLALWRVIEFTDKPTAKNLYWMAFVSALGMSNHWPLMALSAIAFPIMIVPVWRDFFRLMFSRHGLGVVGLVLVALSPYAYSWFRSAAEPMISFYGPINNLKDFWFVLSRSGYSGIDDAGGNWIDKQDFLVWLFESLVSEQITWLGLVLLLFGVYWLIRRKKIAVLIGLIIASLGCSMLLIVLLHFEFDDLSRSIFRVYPLVTWGVFSLLVGIGVSPIYSWVRRYRFKTVVLAGLLVIPLWLFVENLDKNKHPKETWAHQLAMGILQSLEKNAILFTHDDTHLPLMYLHVAEHVRPDITLFNTQSLILDNRLTSVFRNLKYKKQAYREFAQETSRPFYTFYEDENPYGGISNGIYIQGARQLHSSHTKTIIDLRLFDLVSQGNAFLENSAWSRSQKLKHAYQLSRLLLDLPTNTPNYQEAKRAMLSSPHGRFSYANAWFEKRKPESERDTAFRLMEQVEPMVKHLPPYQQSRYYQTLGKVRSVDFSRLDYDEIEQIFLKGLSVYPKNDNLALFSLLELYAQAKRDEDFQKLYKRYPNAARKSAMIKAYVSGEEEPFVGIRLSEDEATEKIIIALSYLQNEPFNPDEALALITEVEESYPGLPQLSFVRGGAYLIKQEASLAEEQFKKVLQALPGHFDAKVNLIRLYYGTNRWQLIEPMLTEVLKEKPNDAFLLQVASSLKKLELDSEDQKN